MLREKLEELKYIHKNLRYDTYNNANILERQIAMFEEIIEILEKKKKI